MKAVIALARRHPVGAYFALAFAISWGIWIPMALAGANVVQGSAWPTHIPGLFGPLIAAFVMSAVMAARVGVRDLVRRMFRWRVAVRWYLAALSPLAFYGGAIAVMAAAGQGWPDLGELGKFSGLPVLVAPLMWIVLLVAAYGEETGWRGFAVPRMLNHRSLLATGSLIGVGWALWHIPSMFMIANYRELGLSLIPGFFLGILGGSILLTWLYRASGGSILIVALWHATYNLVSGTAAGQGVVAAAVSTGVMVWAVLIVVVEVRRWLLSRTMRAAVRQATP